MKSNTIMKKLCAGVLALAAAVYLAACSIGPGDGSTTPGTAVPPENTGASIQDSFAGKVTTYKYKDCTFVESIRDEKAYETPNFCTSMQGLGASDEYLYVAKHIDDTYAIIVQYDVEADTQRTMAYYESKDAAEQKPVDCIRHGNDLVVYSDDEATRYLVAATGYNPGHATKPIPCLTRFALDEENGALYNAGFFNLIWHNDAGAVAYVSASALREVGRTAEHHYFLVKNANNFFICRIPVGASGGTLDKPQNIRCYRLFTIDNRNALFANKDGTVSTIDNLECWTNQGFGYSPEDGLIYVPLFNVSNGGFARCENVILTFDVGQLLDMEKLEAVTQNQTLTVFPTTLNFHISYLGQVLFEIESCVFLLDPENGNQHMYFNTNGSTVEKFEGIWQTSYTKQSIRAQCIVGPEDTVYTVAYNYNVPGTVESEWLMNSSDSNYSMLKSTTHVAGITTNLRINCFMRVGYWFTGWQLHRRSDDAWLYSDGNWYTEEQAPSGMEKLVLEDAAPVDYLTAVSDDVITAYAQWQAYS